MAYLAHLLLNNDTTLTSYVFRHTLSALAMAPDAPTAPTKVGRIRYAHWLPEPNYVPPASLGVGDIHSATA